MPPKESDPSCQRVQVPRVPEIVCNQVSLREQARVRVAVIVWVTVYGQTRHSP